jgi:hypothetical protein
MSSLKSRVTVAMVLTVCALSLSACVPVFGENGIGYI